MLSDWLKANGYTQASFAREFGFSRALLSYWCAGVKLPNRDNAERLRNITGIPPAYWSTFKPKQQQRRKRSARVAG